MKIEAENLKEQIATEGLIRELVRNDARRGEYMIMMDDADDERFVQIACDYEDVGGKGDGCFDLEYRSGKDGELYHCTRRVGADEVERILLDELAGRGEWRNGLPWEKEDVNGAGGWTFSPMAEMPPFARVLCQVVVAIAFAIFALVLSMKLFEAARAALRPGAKMDQWIAAGFWTVVACVFAVGPAMQFVKWFRTRGTKRIARGRMVSAEGLRLRRMLPNGLLFLSIWCAIWDAASIASLLTETPGGNRIMGMVALSIGVGMTAYLAWLCGKHLRPSYEVRLSGGMLKEGGRATFEYRFQGDAEKVGRVVFATAACAACEARSGTVGAPPGFIHDSKEFGHPLEIASGSVSLELPRIAEDCHADFQYFFRATVEFKSGPSVASSYRIPLK